MKKIFAAVLVLPLTTAVTTDVLAHEEPTWTDRISLKGDFRLRYESIDEEGEEQRDRARYRARLTFAADVSDNIKIVTQLASGADSPTSRNVTFDGGFDGGDIGFGLAYLEWSATEHLTVIGGKMKRPLFRAGDGQLIWDDDVNPEGIAMKYAQGAFFANGGVFSVEERSSSSDSLLTAVQLGGKFELGDNTSLTAGVGYIAYSDTVGNEPFYNGNANSNSVDIDGNYLYEYKDTEVFAQLDTKLGDWPFSVYAQWVRNSEVDEEDTGYEFGAKLGAAKREGQWEISWIYQDLEADAVVATFSDSNFGGGGTDASGHRFRAAYLVSPSVKLRGTYFVNEVDRFQGIEHDYNRLQLDVQFSFK